MERTNQQSSKPIVTPRTWNSRDVYADYAAKILEKNPEYWGKYNKARRMRNFWIYALVDGKVKEVINFDRWKEVVTNYFMSARIRITLHGETLNMGNYLGRIEAIRVERNHANKKINFRETNKQPKVLNPLTGRMVPETIIFHTDDDWIRVAWTKTKQIANETAYKFVPCSGDKSADGFKEQFSNANLANPALKFVYKYFPYIRERKKQRAA